MQLLQVRGAGADGLQPAVADAGAAVEGEHAQVWAVTGADGADQPRIGQFGVTVEVQLAQATPQSRSAASDGQQQRLHRRIRQRR